VKTTLTHSSGRNKSLIIPAIASMLVTILLFYIDEGYYNFKWMQNWGNWVIFFIYCAIIFIVQLVLRLSASSDILQGADF
jgi:hypothetical protein